MWHLENICFDIFMIESGVRRPRRGAGECNFYYALSMLVICIRRGYLACSLRLELTAYMQKTPVIVHKQ